MKILDFDVDLPVPCTEDELILLCKAGSHSYGLNVEGSDIDVRGITIPKNPKYYFGLSAFDQYITQSPVDLTAYDLRKFISLAKHCNPNILELLWVDESDILFADESYRRLRQHRNAFLSKQARYRFGGYAEAQLRKIQRHRSWLLNPPRVGDSCYTEYRNWKKNRNPKRAELEAEFGYDTKHAMHLIRLLIQCKEILTNYKLDVKQSEANRSFLLDVRSGIYRYEWIVDYAGGINAELDELLENTGLPNKVDFNLVENLCVDLLSEKLGL